MSSSFTGKNAFFAGGNIIKGNSTYIVLNPFCLIHVDLLLGTKTFLVFISINVNGEELSSKHLSADVAASACYKQLLEFLAHDATGKSICEAYLGQTR